MIAFSNKRLMLAAVNLLLVISSAFMLELEFTASSSLKSFVFSWPNISIPMLLLSIYSLVKTLTVKDFNQSYWFDVFCSWSICCLYYFSIMDWIYIENSDIIRDYETIIESSMI